MYRLDPCSSSAQSPWTHWTPCWPPLLWSVITVISLILFWTRSLGDTAGHWAWPASPPGLIYALSCAGGAVSVCRHTLLPPHMGDAIHDAMEYVWIVCCFDSLEFDQSWAAASFAPSFPFILLMLRLRSLETLWDHDYLANCEINSQAILYFLR